MKLRPGIAVSIVSTLLSIPAAQAIKGTYLPESELSKSTCKIKLAKLQTIYTPSHQNGIPNGMRPYTDEIENISMCSSTLVAPQTIITAAHCFVGNNEQLVRKGTFLYPKMDANGQMPAGCNPEGWTKDPKCVDGKVYGTVRSKWIGLELECPTSDGKTESQPISEDGGYPNPLFRADAGPEEMTMRNYDFAVWHLAKPFAKTPVMEVEYDWQKVLANLRVNAKSCRSYGYGLDNEDKSGTLRGTITPITAATPRLLISDLIPGDDGEMILGGRVDHGDSGGTLACVDETGIQKLYGVVSRGGEDMAPMSEYRTELSLYSMPSYNATWAKHVIANGPIKRDLSKKWWYEFTVGYHREVLETSLRDAKACIDENKSAMGREVYKNFYIPAYKDVQNKYLAAQKEARGYPDDGAGLLRARMREILDLANRLLMDCQSRNF